MELNNLATVTTAGSNSVFTYASPDDYATISLDGYFNEARDILDNSSLIIVQGSSGVSFHYVFSNLGDDIVATADNLVGLTTANEIESAPNHGFATAVSGGSKIKTAEIEMAISDAGYDLPTRSITIYVLDTSNLDKQYLCRYDKTEDSWYFELLKIAN